MIDIFGCIIELQDGSNCYIKLIGITLFVIFSVQDIYVDCFPRFTATCFLQHAGFGSFGLRAGETYGICTTVVHNSSLGHKQCYFPSFHCPFGSP